jgi:hypothetical protein
VTEATRETAAIAKLSRDLAEFERKEQALQDVEELAERIFWLAGSSCDSPVLHAGWRCVDLGVSRSGLVPQDGGLRQRVVPRSWLASRDLRLA